LQKLCIIGFHPCTLFADDANCCLRNIQYDFSLLICLFVAVFHTLVSYEIKSRFWEVPAMSSEISDFRPCAHAQSDIQRMKYTETTDD